MEISIDNKKARRYFESSMKFMKSLNLVLDKISQCVTFLAEEATLTDVCIHTAEFQSDVLAIFTTFQIEF